MGRPSVCDMQTLLVVGISRDSIFPGQAWLCSSIIWGAFERHPWAHPRSTESESLAVGGLSFCSLGALWYSEWPGVATVALGRAMGCTSRRRARARRSRSR